jgi:dipeptidyl aminopeptidase/acylaminoacyl peptidase
VRPRDPGFSADGRYVHFRVGDQWWRYDLDHGLARAITNLQMKKAPFDTDEDGLEAQQLRFFPRLADAVEEDRAAHAESVEAARLDAARAAPAWFLGAKKKISQSLLSADGRWLLAVVQDTIATRGKKDHMPRFVTRSGYVEIEDVRHLVGRDPGVPQGLWLLDLERRERHQVDLSSLSGIATDPLSELKAAQDIEPHDVDDPRPVRITSIAWHPREALALVQIRAIDNKDRWLVSLDAGAAGNVVEHHRLTDPAWINWAFNDMGWLHAGNHEYWLLSEESGHSQLYVGELDGAAPRRVTRGDYEVSSVEAGPDGNTVLAITNAFHPTEYDVYRIDLTSGDTQRLTELLGVESYSAHPVSGDLLVRYSAPYLPTQVAWVPETGGPERRLTDTRTARYRAIAWQAPKMVEIPSTHGAMQPIRSKFYPARDTTRAASRPAVLFIHGAGYTQNTHHKFPYYFREQMFHNLLTERGYHVLDMDFRASRGYGRDWRTAIYRQMGTPELEDLLDGVAWLVAEHGVDPERVGVYGGSYGGFMTFMAMFNAPQTFAAGASLRPVTDWSHYNHGYTSNILNTPQVDPDAYRKSSPIEFVEGLQGRLLISHGMLDDNVFYKDSIRLVQRLIDLEKTGWELASYPLEAHAYRYPQSWLDQYRRILALFEQTIGGP